MTKDEILSTMETTYFELRDGKISVEGASVRVDILAALFDRIGKGTKYQGFTVKETPVYTSVAPRGTGTGRGQGRKVGLRKHQCEDCERFFFGMKDDPDLRCRHCQSVNVHPYGTGPVNG